MQVWTNSPRRAFNVSSLALSLAFLCGCGELLKKDKEDKKGGSGATASQAGSGTEPDGSTKNAPLDSSAGTMLFDAKKDLPLDGMTIKRMRAWKSNPPNQAPGDLYLIDEYIIELWYTFADEQVERYVRVQKEVYDSNGLTIDADGWLHFKSSPPGSKSYSYEVGPDGVETVITQSVDAPDTLTTKKDVVIPYDLASITPKVELPWGGQNTVGGKQIASRTLFERNTGSQQKADMGCVVKPADAMGEKLAPKVILVKGVLGDLTYDMKREENRAPATAPKDVGEPLIAWAHSWTVTGANLNTKTLRILHRKSAPIYNFRQVPGAYGDTAVPEPSDLEKLLRSCNAAAKNAGGSFAFFGLGSSGNYSGKVIKVAGYTPYCKDFDDEVNGDAKLIDYSVYPATCGWSNNSRSLPVTGTWNGTKHDYDRFIKSPSRSYDDALNFVEDSEIVELKFD